MKVSNGICLLVIATYGICPIFGYSMSHSFPTKKKLCLPTGKSFTYECKGSLFPSDYQVYFQFIKSMVKVETTEGPKAYEGPFILSNYTSLSPSLTETGRYNVSGGRKDLDFDYRLTVSNVQIEDTGTYTCWIVHESGHALYPILGQFDVSVIGSFVIRTFQLELGKNVTKATDGVLLMELLDETVDGKFFFEVEASTVPENWDIFIGNKTHRRDMNITNCFNISSPDVVNISKSGLVKTQKSLVSQPSLLKISSQYNGKIITFVADNGFQPVQSMSVALIIRYGPTDVRCTPPVVQGPIGSNNLTLICWARGNPLPFIQWSGRALEKRQENISLKEEVDNDWVKSILTIDELTKDFLDKYTVSASNEYGSVFTQVTVRQGQKTIEADVSQGPPKETKIQSANEASYSSRRTSEQRAICSTVILIFIIKRRMF